MHTKGQKGFHCNRPDAVENRRCQWVVNFVNAFKTSSSLSHNIQLRDPNSTNHHFVSLFYIKYTSESICVKPIKRAKTYKWMTSFQVKNAFNLYIQIQLPLSNERTKFAIETQRYPFLLCCEWCHFLINMYMLFVVVTSIVEQV